MPTVRRPRRRSTLLLVLSAGAISLRWLSRSTAYRARRPRLLARPWLPSSLPNGRAPTLKCVGLFAPVCLSRWYALRVSAFEAPETPQPAALAPSLKTVQPSRLIGASRMPTAGSLPLLALILPLVGASLPLPSWPRSYIFYMVSAASLCGLFHLCFAFCPSVIIYLFSIVRSVTHTHTHTHTQSVTASVKIARPERKGPLSLQSH